MRTLVVAEVSSNHGGDMGLAKAFVKAYAGVGVDAIKVQSFQVARLRADDPQRAWLERAELGRAEQLELRECCQEHGVRFLTTVFDVEMAEWWRGMGLEWVKVGSGEGADIHFVQRMVKLFPWVLVGEGLRAKAFSLKVPRDHTVTRMVGTSEYPCRPERAYLKRLLCAGTGWSDHTVGLEASMAAVAMGAEVVECHVSLPDQARPVQVWEKTVEDMRRLCDWRDRVSALWGEGSYRPDPAQVERFVGRWETGV